MDVPHIAEAVGTAIEAAGVAAILIGVIVSTVLAGIRLVKRRPAYGDYRRDLGRSILLGLELLVAGDIIRTVAISPTFESVGLLAAIVLIRTFLSFALEAEINGTWPGRKRGPRTAEAAKE